MDTAKLFINGENQSVILPKEFEFQGSEVYIKNIGNALVLIPKDKPWQAMFDRLSLFSEDFMKNKEELGRFSIRLKVKSVKMNIE